MKKVDLIHNWMVKEHLDDHVYDRWVDWKFDQGNFPKRGEEGWLEKYFEVVDSIPKNVEWSINTRNQEIVFTWKDGKEVVPLEYFYHDKDDQPDLVLVWHENYWDGPLSGIALFNNEYVWFDCIEEDDIGDRKFAIYKMSDKFREEKFKRHQHFQQAVGYHCDHDPNVYKPFGHKDEKKFREYYDTNYQDLDTSDCEKIGEYHWFQFKQWTIPVQN